MPSPRASSPAAKRRKLPPPPSPPSSPPSIPSTASISFGQYSAGSATEEEDNTELKNHYLNRMTDVEDARPVQTVFGPPEEIDVWMSIGRTTYVDLKPEVKEAEEARKSGEKRKMEDREGDEEDEEEEEGETDGASFGGSNETGGMVKSNKAQEEERAANAIQARPKAQHRKRSRFPDLQPLHTLITAPPTAAPFDFECPVLAAPAQDAPRTQEREAAQPRTPSHYWTPRQTSFNSSFGSEDSGRDAVSSF